LATAAIMPPVAGVKPMKKTLAVALAVSMMVPALAFAQTATPAAPATPAKPAQTTQVPAKADAAKTEKATKAHERRDANKVTTGTAAPATK
jgi:Ni/Co efflux regulator RcnB